MEESSTTIVAEHTPHQKVEEDKPTVHCYPRYKMFTIRLQHMEHHYLGFLKAMVGEEAMTQEPFELDEELRCSYEKRLRVLRAREALERRKTLEQRQKEAKQAATVSKPSTQKAKKRVLNCVVAKGVVGAVAATPVEPLIGGYLHGYERFKQQLEDSKKQRYSFPEAVVFKSRSARKRSLI